VLNIILYNSSEKIKNEVNKRLKNTPTPTVATVSEEPPAKDDAYVMVHNNDAVIDQKIDLITEGAEKQDFLCLLNMTSSF
jgi:hypothetical protein